jgi:hypothetical protein
MDELAVWMTIMGVWFDIPEPRELLDHIRTLVDRLWRSCGER